VQEQKIRLKSGELSYFRAGSGPPLLYFHPAGGVRRSKVTAGLADSFSLYVPVIPGWEGTAFHAGVSTRHALAELMAEFHAGVIGTRCDVMGWSFGGAVALWLALERPELVDRLVLECPAGLLSIDKRIKRVNRKLLEHYGAEDGKDQALIARVAEVGHTTLILQGTNDGTIPPASAEWLARQLRRASLVLIEQAGHDLEMDQPERVLAAAREFLNLSRGQPR
jgi:pimeloyl-ACP methyl ester carboxylesterase